MFVDAWTEMTKSMLRSSRALNRAALSLFRNEATREPLLPAVDSVAFDQHSWEFERSVDTSDEITIGDTVSFSKVLHEDDIRAFAQITGDTNRLHLDDEFAEKTRFGGRISHGALVAGIISAALARLPGLTIYLSQDLNFLHPVRIGDRVRGRVDVIEALAPDRYRLSTVIETETAGQATTVVDGEAVVLIDELPDP
ncbi:MaoC family dehydratase [Halosolutus halophilus]|uniref:MaoC family dehydratase n=1 Tax=Halosolutus halophilus TaxID=1552990 RepID=UPI00223520BB|nr:MaoC family dehydratase [Halosolutus halophilus]